MLLEIKNTPELCFTNINTPVYSYFGNWTRDCQIKMAAPFPVIMKYFKACIFQTVGPIFMKFLPNIMVCKKNSQRMCVRHACWLENKNRDNWPPFRTQTYFSSCFVGLVHHPISWPTGFSWQSDSKKDAYFWFYWHF